MGGDVDLAAITANDLRRFIIGLQGKGKFANHPYNRPQQERLSPYSIATYCRGVKAFFAYLYREGLIEQNPMQKVKLPRVPYKVVPTFSERQVERLLSQIDKKSDTGFRDYAIILTFLDTAIRLSELAGLKVNDVDFENGYLRVMGKGSKERFVPFGQKVAKVLLKYKLKHRPEPLANDYFWLTREGRPLTADRVEKIVSYYGDRAGISRCYAHKLRHTSSVIHLVCSGSWDIVPFR
jgi:site-specific recombinase XerD